MNIGIIHFGKHEKIIRTWQDHVNFVHRKKKSPISSARWTFTCKPQFGCHSFWKTVRLNDRAILLWQDQQSKLFFFGVNSQNLASVLWVDKQWNTLLFLDLTKLSMHFTNLMLIFEFVAECLMVLYHSGSNLDIL